MPDDMLSIREALDADIDEIVSVCKAALGWSDGDPNEALFRWKHFENPFGRSPIWVCVDSGALVGARAFMRWEFTYGAETIKAVRAVDTATLPRAQGKGIFKRLTLGALPSLREAEVDAVFNTPNDKSRPGYLKMGWKQLGRVPIGARLTSLRSVANLTGALAPASLVSESCDYGSSAPEVFKDTKATSDLIAGAHRPTGISTALSAHYLQWRYSLPHLRYRATLLGTSLEDGVIVFRLRKRGTAVEATICNVIAPPGTPTRKAVRAILRNTKADYGLATRSDLGYRDMFVPAPTLGPILTWKPLNRVGLPTIDETTLSIGDVELF